MRTYDDVMRAVLRILPNAQLEEDNDGQSLIHTDLVLDEKDELSAFVSSEDE